MNIIKQCSKNYVQSSLKYYPLWVTLYITNLRTQLNLEDKGRPPQLRNVKPYNRKTTFEQYLCLFNVVTKQLVLLA